MSTAEHTALVDLLVAKDEEFRKMLDLADEQAKLEQKMDDLKAKVDVQVSQLKFTECWTKFAMTNNSQLAGSILISMEAVSRIRIA